MTEKINRAVLKSVLTLLAMCVFYSCTIDTEEGGDLLDAPRGIKSTEDVSANTADMVYNMGDRGPADGYVFYDKGYYEDGWRYMEAAPYDQLDASNSLPLWGCNGTQITGADNTVIGTGNANTLDIVNSCFDPSFAAGICFNLLINGYEDWFLPSFDELNLIYWNLHTAGIGGFVYGVYWSSTEADANNARAQDFNDGSQYYYLSKGYNYSVRAVRVF